MNFKLPGFTPFTKATDPPNDGDVEMTKKEQRKHRRNVLKYNKKKLQKYIDKYDGKVIHGVLVTESGLLAAAHLGGAGSVRKWFRTGKIRKDGNMKTAKLNTKKNKQAF